jgi:hypothetical protein
LTPKLRGYNPEAALNSLKSHGKPSRPIRPLERHIVVSHSLVVHYVNRDLNKPTLAYFGPVTPLCPDLVVCASKTPVAILANFLMTPSYLC